MAEFTKSLREAVDDMSADKKAPENKAAQVSASPVSLVREEWCVIQPKNTETEPSNQAERKA